MSKKVDQKFYGLKYLRELCSNKQEDFGKLIGVGICQYSKKESGTQPFYLNECRTLQQHINKELGTDYSMDEIFLQGKLPIRNFSAL